MSTLTKVGLVCLPWLPLMALSLTVYERFFAPKYVTEAFISVNGPSFFYTPEEQWAQIYPHWNLIVAGLLCCALTFIGGIVLLLTSFIRHRIRSGHATQTV